MVPMCGGCKECSAAALCTVVVVIKGPGGLAKSWELASAVIKLEGVAQLIADPAIS